MLKHVQRILDYAFREIRHHANPEHQLDIRIEPVNSTRDRLTLSALLMFGIGMVPVALLLPLLPTWPFVFVAIACVARMSTRFRNWLTANRVFRTAMSVIRTRPERVFRWADQLTHVALGTRAGAGQR